MDNKDKPAFPVTVKYDESGKAIGYQNGSETGQEIGLSKRELIAAMCLQGLISNPVYNNPDNPKALPTVPNFAIAATKYADALLAELSKS